MAACLFAVAVLTGSTSAQQYTSMAPKVLASPDFNIPPSYITKGIDGYVYFDLKVDKQGRVKSVDITGGPAFPCGTYPSSEMDEVNKIVKSAAMGYRFAPDNINGKPIEFTTHYEVRIGNAFSGAMSQTAAAEAVSTGADLPKIVDYGSLVGYAKVIPRPYFPPAAVKIEKGGKVSVEVLIDESGDVVLAGVINGPPIMHRSSIEAACRSKFAPTVLRGHPVKAMGYITFAYDAHPDYVPFKGH